MLKQCRWTPRGGGGGAGRGGLPYKTNDYRVAFYFLSRTNVKQGLMADPSQGHLLTSQQGCTSDKSLEIFIYSSGKCNVVLLFDQA